MPTKLSIRNFGFSVLSLLLLSTFLSVSVFTADSSSPSNSSSSSISKDAKAIARCDIIASRIEVITLKYNANKDSHIKHYQDLKDKTSKIVDRVGNQGVDTSKLKTDLNTLDAKIKTFAQDYSNYVNLLNDTKNYTCGKSEGEFKISLEKARASLLKVKQDDIDLKKIIQTLIKPDIQTIKDQLNK